jgi:hypothetical protein
LDNLGLPLEGVIIQGGIDWTHFYVITDNQGRALIPGGAYDLMATLRKNNFFTKRIDQLKPGAYSMYPTPYVFTEIGDIQGEAVKFRSDQIVTINNDGEYRVYSYDENGVTEEGMTTLPYEPRFFKFQRDSLWFLANDGDIYVYYMVDVFNPFLRLHLDLNRELSIFDWDDSLLAVGSPYSTGSGVLEIFSFYSDSSLYELDEIGDFIIEQIFFVSDYLVILGFQHSHLSVFDISNPSRINLAHFSYLYTAESSFLWGDTLGINYGWGGNNIRCRLFDLSDPVNPAMIANFAVDGPITEMINDTLAVGRYKTYEYDYGSPCVFRGSNPSNLQTVALLSEQGYSEHRGNRAPYFIIGEKLWRLEER